MKTCSLMLRSKYNFWQLFRSWKTVAFEPRPSLLCVNQSELLQMLITWLSRKFPLHFGHSWTHFCSRLCLFHCSHQNLILQVTSHHTGANLVCSFSTNIFFFSLFRQPLFCSFFFFFSFLTLCVRENNSSPKEVHMRIPGACDYVTLHVTRDFTDVI